MEFKYVVLGLKDRNVEGIINLGGTVASEMLANAATFPAPPVTPANLQTAVDALISSHEQAALTRSRIDFGAERSNRAIVEDMLRKNGVYVDLIANGNENVIMKAGMPFSKNRERHPAPDQVTNFKSVFTGIPNTLELIWRRPKFSRLFRVYVTTTPDDMASWRLVDIIDTRRLMVRNLASGQRFYFKVVAENAAGVSPDSEIAEGLAA